MSRILILSCVLISFLLGACTKKEETSSAPVSKEVNLSIWGNYLSSEMKEAFEKESGIKINISNYSSNEELLAKIQAGASGIDVAVPSDYMVEVLAKMDQLEPLNMDQIPNKSQIDEKFLKQSYDPENKFSVPYTWTTAGIAVNKELYKEEIKSWKDLLANPKLKGKFALLDDVRETMAAALKMNGHSVNTTNEEEIKKAKAVLLKTKKDVKMFSSDTIDILNNKEVAAAQTYSSDALQAAAKNKNIAYILPTEGGTVAIDNLVILKGSKNKEAAHKLINFLMSEKAEQNKVSTIYGGPVLKNTKATLAEDLKANKALFPEDTSKLESLKDLGDKTKLYEDAWTEIKTN
ncbi:polyamine ABC transporter substrate-binding protein [Bdellovibrio reynosensis]|uniref:Spermidine/putrescine ABC transporter substrate-binding protein n=1 Tax=Bdellovibrio reynosensis TaxID=2835041 RepID=A0ABY4CCI7_9BACT|nr:spermidine/putrescine ABC transporter substrate-binding protein [Bdellovibrio reynosensis]UOF02494.1 spermidine/putrescine ABC transporter substrate-binding protein [Bdellovibrio reynosensis]